MAQSQVDRYRPPSSNTRPLQISHSESNFRGQGRLPEPGQSVPDHGSSYNQYRHSTSYPSDQYQTNQPISPNRLLSVDSSLPASSTTPRNSEVRDNRKGQSDMKQDGRHQSLSNDKIQNGNTARQIQEGSGSNSGRSSQSAAAENSNRSSQSGAVGMMKSQQPSRVDDTGAKSKSSGSGGKSESWPAANKVPTDITRTNNTDTELLQMGSRIRPIDFDISKPNKKSIKDFHSSLGKGSIEFKANKFENEYFELLLGYQHTNRTQITESTKMRSKNDVVLRLKKGKDYDSFDKPDLFKYESKFTVDSRNYQIGGISDVCILKSSGNIVITDPRNSRLQVFDGISGKPILPLVDPTRLRHSAPSCVCESLEGEGAILVTDRDRVLHMDAKRGGDLFGKILIKDKTDLRGIAITAANKLILSEVGLKPSIAVYETTGKLIQKFSTKHKVVNPIHIAWSDEYEICAVSDIEQNTVLLYDVEGRFINKITQYETTAGGGEPRPTALVCPTGLCWMPQGRLLVADQSNNQVVLFDLKNFKSHSVLSKESHGISNPVALTSNQRDSIVVVEDYVKSNRCCLKSFQLREC